ncbi:hypothetical protein MHBO_004828 [Bonamia ostreae]|uniref:Uncharacterized protein n=1 Tax=Bonamia ostreae TaxID=126728 RepID=A0ABV2AUY7_9EUKA
MDTLQSMINYTKLATEILKQQTAHQCANTETPAQQLGHEDKTIAWGRRRMYHADRDPQRKSGGYGSSHNLVAQILDDEPAGTSQNQNI